MPLKLRLFLAGLLVLFSATAMAHQQGTSYSRWQLDGVDQVSVKVSELDLTQAKLHPDYSDNYYQQVAVYLQARLLLQRDDAACKPGPANVYPLEQGWLNTEWTFTCPAESGEYQLRSDILLDVAPGHLHFARWQHDQGSPDQLLSEGSNRWRLSDDGEQRAQAALAGFDFLGLGIEHILTGWDHLAFVLGLLLLAKRLRTVLWLISGFTVGHSATLALATLGWITPNIAAIEAVIAWSIALVAADYLWQRFGRQWFWVGLPIALLAVALAQGYNVLYLALAVFTVAYFVALAIASERRGQLRGLVTLAFGLIHGCGFAAVLADLNLATERLGLSLLSFNIGVELAQLLVLALAWPLLVVLRKYAATALPVLAVCLLVVASYWWVLRVAA